MLIPFDNDEWEAWREHPITSWLLDEYLAEQAYTAKETFIKFAWEKGGQSSVYHASLFERAKTINEIRELTYIDFEVED